MNKFIRKAFTLIELLVVIAIIGILSGLIVVSMNGITQKATIAKAQVFSDSLKNSLMMSLVSEWKFDDGSGTTAIDSWSGGNNGTLNGFSSSVAGYGDSHSDGWMSSLNCVSGTCLEFNGTSDYVNFTSSSFLDSLSNYTLGAWIYIDSTGSFTGRILSRDRNSGTNNFVFAVYTDHPDIVFYDASGTQRELYDTTYSFSKNVWIYFVGVRDGTNLKYYVNGALNSATQAVGNGLIETAAKPLIIGSGSNQFWTGRFDEIRVYNAAVPASQIKEQYYAGLNKLLNNGGITKEEYLSRINQTLANR